MPEKFRFCAFCLLILVVSCTLVCLTGALDRPTDFNGQSKDSPAGGQPPHYKEYHNQRFNFSFQYPEQWDITEPFTENGAVIKPKRGPHLPELSVAGEIVQADQTGRAQTLEEEFESRVASLRKNRPHASHHINNIVVVKKELTNFQGFPAIASTITYDIDDQSWIDEGIMFHVSDDFYSFGISFSCHPEELSVFQPAYNNVVHTFRFVGELPHRDFPPVSK